MPSPPHPLPPGLGDVFTPARARASGASAGRLRAHDLAAPFAGVRVVVRSPGEPDDAPLAHDRAERARVRQLAHAYAPLMAPHAFVAGRSALVWHGVGIEHGSELDVAVWPPERAPRRRGIRSRSLAPHLAHTVSCEGVRVASPASAWAMLAHELDVPELVRVGDQLVRIPRGAGGAPEPWRRLATPEQLRAAVRAGRRRGIERLVQACELVRVGSMSRLETDFRLEIVSSGLPEPDLDVEIRSPDGRLLGISDAAYRGHGLLMEVEGDHHRTSRAQWERDIAKHTAYAAAGWQLVRLSASQIRGARPTAALIVRDALRRAGADL